MLMYVPLVVDSLKTQKLLPRPVEAIYRPKRQIARLIMAKKHLEEIPQQGEA